MTTGDTIKWCPLITDDKQVISLSRDSLITLEPTLAGTLEDVNVESRVVSFSNLYNLQNMEAPPAV